MYGEQDIELIIMPSMYGEQDIELIIMRLCMGSKILN